MIQVRSSGKPSQAAARWRNEASMVRKEGLRPVPVLPLLTGLVILAVIGLEVAADRVGSPRLSLVTTVTVRRTLVQHNKEAWGRSGTRVHCLNQLTQP